MKRDELKCRNQKFCLLSPCKFHEAQIYWQLARQNVSCLLGLWAKKKMQDKSGMLEECRRRLCQVFDEKRWAQVQKQGSCLLRPCHFEEASLARQNVSYLLGYWAKIKMQDKAGMLWECRRRLCQVSDEKRRAQVQKPKILSAEPL